MTETNPTHLQQYDRIIKDQGSRSEVYRRVICEGHTRQRAATCGEQNPGSTLKPSH